MRRFAQLLLPVVVILTIFADGLNARQWTRFRGPNGSGVGRAERLPVNWTEKDYKWRVALPGIGHSSPVVYDDQIFVTSADQDNGTRTIQCRNTADGSLVWQHSFPSITFDLNKATAFDTASPTVDGDCVYMVWGTPEKFSLLAFEKEGGNEVWRRELPGPFEGDHNFGSSPILFGELLILQNDLTNAGFVIALDRRTGETQWKTDRRILKTAYSTPFILNPDTESPELVLASSADGVSSLDPRTGKSNWEVADLFGDIRVVGSPATAGGLIFAQCGAGGAGRRFVAVRPPAAERGIEAGLAYELDTALPYVPVPVAKGDRLFLISDGGVGTCIDATTGNVLWRERVGGNYFGSPVRVADRIYCISRSGEVAVWAAADRFELLGRVDLGEASHSTPAISGGVMYLRTFSHLMALDGN